MRVLNDHAEELARYAAYIGTLGKGILDAVPSTDTIKKHLPGIRTNAESVEKRDALLEILFTTPRVHLYIGAVVVFEETLRLTTGNGKPLLEVLNGAGVIPGIKIEKDETFALDFAQHCQMLYKAGARFVNWCAVFNTGPYPDKSRKSGIDKIANKIAERAAIMQQHGLVPFLELKILITGPHAIKQYASVTDLILDACFRALIHHDVMLEGTLLKLNMVTPGSYSPEVAPEVIAEHTVHALQRTLDTAVPAIVFSSGGQSEENVILILDAMRKLQIQKPWALSFPFGDDLHQSILKAWAGKAENVQKAQIAFLIRCKANFKATVGDGDKDLAEELARNAAYLGTPGKGILDVVTSTDTIKKHLPSIRTDAESVEKRDALFEILFTTAGAFQYIGAVLVFEETLYLNPVYRIIRKQRALFTFFPQDYVDFLKLISFFCAGKPLLEVLNEAGVIPGINIDKDEIFAQDFAQRCQMLYEAGARFVKWCPVFRSGPHPDDPEKLEIDKIANENAKRAAIMQQHGLVPFLEPAVLVYGPHDIKQYADVIERVLDACYKALKDHHVMLEGTLLKLNMVTPGSYSPRVAPEVIAEHTVGALRRSVLAAVPAIVFSSGGQSEGNATLILNAMRKLQIKKPWAFSFSFGDDLLQSILKAWAGKEENVQKAQRAFLVMCKANFKVPVGDDGDKDLAEELARNAAYIGTPGKGILDVVASTDTIKKHLPSIRTDAESVEKGDAFFEILFTTPRALQYIRAVLVFEDTLYQNPLYGKPFLEVLNDAGVIPGIKIDKDETFAQDFAQRCQMLYEAGARFVKWCTVFKAGPRPDMSKKIEINKIANRIAERAAIMQQHGLVPFFEPKILIEGQHAIRQYAKVTELVLIACVKALIHRDVMLEGTLLKLNMVTPGSYSPEVAPEVIAEHTVHALQRTLPAAVPAIVFSSGGQSEENVILILDAMRKLQSKKLWAFSFSFGDDLHQSVLKVWAGEENNVHEAQKAFLVRCKTNSQARAGDESGIKLVLLLVVFIFLIVGFLFVLY
ncbi:hypothetical protein PTKIN_Ptkin08bG0026300 [Pterospermum kingtungense]